jgi:hypothetical protein
MKYLYHFIPSDMRGEVLYPLNEVRDRWPDVYESAAAKYVGREYLMNERIPILNCLWNDVLHFSTLDPRVILEGIRKIDGKGKTKRQHFLRVRAEKLDGMPAVVMGFGEIKVGDTFSTSNAEFSAYQSHSFVELSEVPFRTIEYWKQAYASGKPLLMFNFVPHVLLRSPFEISDGEIIPF